MAKRPMKKLELLALAKDRDALLKTLQKAGVMELEKAETEGWQQAAQAEWAEHAEEEAQAARQAAHSCSSAASGLPHFRLSRMVPE